MPSSFANAIKKLDTYVRQLVKLNTPNAQGVSKRKTLEGAMKKAKANGKSNEELAVRFKELQPVPLARGTEYLLRTFNDLSGTRPLGPHGPLAIPYTEIKAYCELTDTDLVPWEVEALRVMDNAFLDEARIVNEARAKSTGQR